MTCTCRHGCIYIAAMAKPGRSATDSHGMENAPRVLMRASRLLSQIGESPGASVITLASAADLPVATTSRLLNALFALGWVDRQGARGGWRIGPRLHAMMCGLPYRERLIGAARATMEHLAKELGAPVTLSGLMRDRRQILCESAPDGAAMSSLCEQDDLYYTAAGRVLIAHLPPAQRRRQVDRIGRPRRVTTWAGVLTRLELLRALAQIRRQGSERFVRSETRSVHEAVAIPDGDGGTVALSTRRPADHVDQRPQLAEAARAIAATLGIRR